jgi:hypothetical protein
MPDNSKPQAVGTLMDDECHDIVDQIRQILRFDFAANEWNPDKEWDIETLEYISGVLEDYGQRIVAVSARLLQDLYLIPTGSIF